MNLNRPVDPWNKCCSMVECSYGCIPSNVFVVVVNLNNCFLLFIVLKLVLGVQTIFKPCSIQSYFLGVEGVSSGDELDSDEDDDLSPENDGFMGGSGRGGVEGSIAGASGSGSGGQNVRANVVGKRRPNGPTVNR